MSCTETGTTEVPTTAGTSNTAVKAIEKPPDPKRPFGLLIPSVGETHFSMFSAYRNSLLQQCVSLNPRLINRAVDQARESIRFDCFDKEPPYNRLCSEQPRIPVQDIDVVRRHVAFGTWALPRLYRELHSVDPIVQLQAINSICDIIRDPEKVYEAIRLKFVPRLANLVMTTRSNAFRERILISLKTIASHAVGREEIVNRRVLLDGFKDLIAHNDKSVRRKTAAVIEMLSRGFEGNFVLLEEGYIPTLLEYVLVDEPDVCIFHLETLEKLFTHAQGQEEGLAYDAISKMVQLLEHDEKQVVCRAANCLAMLVSHPQGKKISVEKQLLIKLTNLLFHESRLVYTSAAMVIMFGTHTVRAKHQAASIVGLAERLLELCNDFNSPPTQMFAMKALGNMMEHPAVRRTFVRNYMDKLEAIRVCDLQELKDFKEILLKITKWKPWLGY